MMVTGWKGILTYLEKNGVAISIRTLKNWHYKKEPIPFRKTSKGIGGRVYIYAKDLTTWFDRVTSSA